MNEIKDETFFFSQSQANWKIPVKKAVCLTEQHGAVSEEGPLA